MTSQEFKDEWQSRLYDASYRYSLALKELHDSNPWPEHPAVEDALSTLATELWDQCFSQSEILRAYRGAIESLPHYTAGREYRP